MQSWVRENLKNLARAGELGKRATTSPVVLHAAHPAKTKGRKTDDVRTKSDDTEGLSA